MISFLLWDPSLWNTTKKLGPEWVNSRIKAVPETALAAATHLGRLVSVGSGREQGPSVNALRIRGQPAAMCQVPLNTMSRPTVCQALLGPET